MKFIKQTLKILLLALLLLWTARFCREQTDGFTLLKISSHLPYDPKWDVVAPPSNEIQSALTQNYHYLAKGAQCYVFSSSDEHYVIKFFRQSLYHPPCKKKKKQAREKDFQSYKIAYEELKEETGLIYLHLNKTKNSPIPLTIVDKLGIQHHLDLNEYEFYIQKRAILVQQKIESLMQQSLTGCAKEALHSLFHLLESRFEKKIHDSDPNMKKNFGFIGERAVQIDIGRFSELHFSKQRSLHSVVKKKEDLHFWINQHYPELSSCFEEEFNQFVRHESDEL